MQDQLTVSSSVLPSYAQQHPSPSSSLAHSSSPSRRRRRPCRSWDNFGFKSFWAKCWLTMAVADAATRAWRGRESANVNRSVNNGNQSNLIAYFPGAADSDGGQK
jgi:hypothetical protein